MGQHKFKKGSGTSHDARRSRFSAALGVVIAVVIVVGAINLFKQNAKGGGINDFLPERSKGNPQAALKIVEFADFQCSHCKHGAEIIKNYMKQYPDGIYLTMKFFPLGQLNSSMSAFYAQCAARQGKFWDMHDELFATQDSWRTLLRVQDFYNTIAQPLGLDVVALQECSEEKDVRALVARERSLGDSYFVKSTPTYFINGKMVVGIKELEEALKAHFENSEKETQ